MVRVDREPLVEKRKEVERWNKKQTCRSGGALC